MTLALASVISPLAACPPPPHLPPHHGNSAMEKKLNRNIFSNPSTDSTISLLKIIELVNDHIFPVYEVNSIY